METTGMTSIPGEQHFGARPEACRDTDHYREEYIESFVDKWDELIDWDSRAASEGDFFIRFLREHGARRILDVATGTGFHSVRLMEAGFDVVSADGSAEMLAKAFQNGRRRGHILRTVLSDWRQLNRDIHGRYDAVICLGNSFTHLFNEHDRRKALAEFYSALNHDGVLILDQRNYDAILDHGYSSKHTFYYCGNNISVYPEHVDPGLTRFRYGFPDKSVYHLNMFPLRKPYVRRLMREVGFQEIRTYGDFQETYREHEPDFFVHCASKNYTETPVIADDNYSSAVATARDYYNSDDADRFYHRVWGGEDIHVGLYESDTEAIFDASRRTVAHMADLVGEVSPGQRILDMGSGYGGAARYLAGNFGARVVALNLSEVENARAHAMNAAQNLDHLIDSVSGSFEEVPYPDEYFDVVWSQDAFLHSGDRRCAIRDAARVLKPGGLFIFTDPMQTDTCPDGVLQPILDRLHLQTLGSPAFYREQCRDAGLQELGFEEHSEQLRRHYGRVLQETELREPELEGEISPEYIQRMKRGLRHWVDGSLRGYLCWGIFRFRKA